MKNKKYEKEKELHISIIDKVIEAKSGGDLHTQLVRVNEWDWMDNQRKMFLTGLLQGALMQFKKDVSIEELKTIFCK